jgi:hypothetical protein
MVVEDCVKSTLVIWADNCVGKKAAPTMAASKRVNGLGKKDAIAGAPVDE